MRIPEGDPHKAVIEAISRRIRQLYPPSYVRIRENKQLGRFNFRPDIYVEHDDGHKWAYEIVHGNSRGLQEKHDLYAHEGISDVWVLWQTLGPKTKLTSQPDQGVLLGTGDEQWRYQLNKPERQLLSLQAGDERFLYVFTIDPVYRGVELTELMKTLTLGFETYKFVGWKDRHTYPASFEFVSLAEAVFDAQGRPGRVEQSEAMLDDFFKQLGFDPSSTFIPSDIMGRADRLVATPDELKKVAPLYLAYRIMALPATEQQEIMTYFKSEKPKQLQAFSTPNTDREVAQAFRDANAMQEFASEAQRLKVFMQQMDAPEPLKRILLDLVDSKQVEDMAELMKWQADSKALQGARRSARRG